MREAAEGGGAGGCGGLRGCWGCERAGPPSRSSLGAARSRALVCFVVFFGDNSKALPLSDR